MKRDRNHSVMPVLAGIAFMLTPWPVAGQVALMPEPNADFSAFRVDCDVFGWNKAFTEMGVLGSEVRRYPKGKQRGEAFVLVFDVGSITPKQNVHVLYITQADMPHDPLPIDDVRDKMWGVDWNYQQMWPRRPKRKHFRGAMQIEPLSDIEEIEPTLCRPAVGFLLRYEGRVRYQPHQAMKMKASCATLRPADHRTYWAKKDLGAVMIRYDYSPDDHEQSIRFPLSAAWSLGDLLRIQLRVASGIDAGAAAAARTRLSAYGVVDVATDAPDVTADGVRVDYRADRRYLATHLAKVLGGKLGKPINDADVVVLLGVGATGPDDGDRPAVGQRDEPSIRAAPREKQRDATPSTYLEDFAP